MKKLKLSKMSELKPSYDTVVNLDNLKSSNKTTSCTDQKDSINSLKEHLDNICNIFHLNEIDYNFTMPKAWSTTGIIFSGIVNRAKECISLISCPQDICQILSKCENYEIAVDYILANDHKILSSITTGLKDDTDFYKHLQEAVTAYNNGLYRASQSCSVIAIDTKLQNSSDFKEWGMGGASAQRLASKAFSHLKNNGGESPALWPSNHKVPFYSICLLESIYTFDCEHFEINNKETWDKKYLNRHMSVHTTSSQQYSKSHALMSIMLACDLNYVEKNYGKKWLENILKAYEVMKEK